MNMNYPLYKDPLELVGRMHETTFTHARLFDDLLIVANPTTAAFVLKTTDGLILFEGIYPKEEMFQAIVAAIEDIGWNPSEIKKFFITHGHFDHAGCGKWVVENYHPQVYLSKVDDEYWRDVPFFKDRPDTWKNFEITDYVKDGDEIRLGATVIKVLSTPGHTPGGLSYIFPVHENGVEHMAIMMGGTNPPYDIAGIVQYMKSLEYMLDEVAKNHCEVALNNHPSFEGYAKIEYSKNRCAHMPNCYINSEKEILDFYGMFRYLCYNHLRLLAEKYEND